MAILAISYVVLAAVADSVPGRVPTAALALFSTLFAAEFAARLWDSPSRWRYFRSHWIDVVACIPFVGALRGLRVLRLLRLAAGLHVLRSVETLARDVGGRASLWYVCPALLALWLGGSYGVWLAEHGSNPAMRSFGDALYLTFTSVTTPGAGSGGVSTPTGRVIVAALVFIGVGLLGLVSSRLAAWWLKADDAAHVQELASLRAEIAALRSELRVHSGLVAASARLAGEATVVDGVHREQPVSGNGTRAE